jgi:hypothetical protein
MRNVPPCIESLLINGDRYHLSDRSNEPRHDSVIRAVENIKDFNFHTAPLRLDLSKTVTTGQRPFFFTFGRLS